MQILGPWVAVQPVEAMMAGGGMILKPWEARAPECFVAEVLALGTEIHDAPFGVGDFVLVETMSGHPAMATEWPDIIRQDGKRVPGRTHPVDMKASELGGDPSSPLGLVRWLGGDLPACQFRDEEATRRMERAGYLAHRETENKKHLGSEPDMVADQEVGEHHAWLKANEAARDGMRRSRLMRPANDPGMGEGIVAVLTEVDDLLRLGVAKDWLAGRLVAQGLL